MEGNGESFSSSTSARAKTMKKARSRSRQNERGTELAHSYAIRAHKCSSRCKIISCENLVFLPPYAFKADETSRGASKKKTRRSKVKCKCDRRHADECNAEALRHQASSERKSSRKPKTIKSIQSSGWILANSNLHVRRRRRPIAKQLKAKQD
jgi:hypothetical protein